MSTLVREICPVCEHQIEFVGEPPEKLRCPECEHIFNRDRQGEPVHDPRPKQAEALPVFNHPNPQLKATHAGAAKVGVYGRQLISLGLGCFCFAVICLLMAFFSRLNTENGINTTPAIYLSSLGVSFIFFGLLTSILAQLMHIRYELQKK
jgi:hypothetical protein